MNLAAPTFLLVLLLACSPSTPQPKGPPQSRLPVVGVVTVERAFDCAGVGRGGPPLTTLTPGGRKLIVRRGQSNFFDTPVAEVTTGPGGRFQVALPPGTYCVVGEGKRDLVLQQKGRRGGRAGVHPALAALLRWGRHGAAGSSGRGGDLRGLHSPLSEMTASD